MECSNFFRLLKDNDFNFMTGVPCSIFKHFINFINDQKIFNHVVASCEGQACGIATGYHLATNKVPIIYMQNSGLGNSVNPLTSLLDKSMFNIPSLLFISWRGEPEKKDEPQHKKMGEILVPLLELLGIPYDFLTDNIVETQNKLNKAKLHFEEHKTPYALIFAKNYFGNYQTMPKTESDSGLSRESAIQILLDNLLGDEIIISTTGKTSRECYENKKLKQLKNPCFYNVGAMGSAGPIGLGFALNSSKKVIILDGDGAVLMKKGIFSTIGHYQPKNLIHVIFDNNSYESTGGQKTVSESVDFTKVAEACNYKNVKFVDSTNLIGQVFNQYLNFDGPNLLVIPVKKGARSDLGRPTESPEELKLDFINSLNFD